MLDSGLFGSETSTSGFLCRCKAGLVAASTASLLVSCQSLPSRLKVGASGGCFDDSPQNAASDLMHNALHMVTSQPLPPQDDLKAEHFLWQLYHLDRDLTQARGEVQRHQAAMGQAAKAHQAAEAAVEEKRRALAGLQKSRIQLAKGVTERRSELDKQVQLPSRRHCMIGWIFEFSACRLGAKVLSLCQCFA